jgi:two-component system nitrogen regulation sensor histidine kinase NtrY
LNGPRFGEVLQRAPPALQSAATQPGDSLFSAEIDGIEETFHLSQRSFMLQGRPYRVYLLKRLTRELSRQVVSTWKKLIRVLSHELNNSLGPLSSLAHFGAEIARREAPSMRLSSRLPTPATNIASRCATAGRA